MTNYGVFVSVWSLLAITDIIKLEQAQCTAARCFFNDKLHSVSNLLDQLIWTTVET